VGWGGSEEGGVGLFEPVEEGLVPGGAFGEGGGDVGGEGFVPGFEGAA